MHILSKQITDFLVKRKTIPVEAHAIYEYGFEILLSDSLSILLVFCMSIIAGAPYAGGIYLACFISTRIFCGGFHASSHSICRFAMIVTFGIYLLLIKMFSPTLLILFCGLAVGWIPLLLYAPVVSKKKMLSQQCKLKNRIRAVSAYAVWSCVSIILATIGQKAGVYIILTLWIVSANIVFAKLVERRFHK